MAEILHCVLISNRDVLTIRLSAAGSLPIMNLKEPEMTIYNPRSRDRHSKIICSSIVAVLLVGLGFVTNVQAIPVDLKTSLIALTSDQSFSRSTPTQLNDHGTVAYNPIFNLYTGDGLSASSLVNGWPQNGSGHKINDSNTIIGVENTFVSNDSSFFSKSNILYLADGTRVSVIDDNANVQSNTSARDLDLNDNGVAAYVSGNIDGNSNDERLYRFTPGGVPQQILTFADNGLRRDSFAQLRLDLSGNVYFEATDIATGEPAIYRVDANNALTKLFGESDFNNVGTTVSNGRWVAWDVSDNGTVATSYVSTSTNAIRILTHTDSTGLVDAGVSTPAGIGSANGNDLETNDNGDFVFFKDNNHITGGLEVWASFSGGDPQSVVKSGDIIGGLAVVGIFQDAFDLNQVGQISVGVSSDINQLRGDKSILRFDPPGTSSTHPLLSGQCRFGTGISTCDYNSNDPRDFINRDVFRYYDPVVAVGYEFDVLLGKSPFTSVIIPFDYGDGVFDLFLFNDLLGDFTDSGFDLFTGIEFDFITELGISEGLTRFSIRGIEISAGIDPTDPAGFVTGLKFSDTLPIGFSMSALSFDTDADTGASAVPEPSSFAMLAIGLFFLGRFHRRNKRIN